MALRAIGLPTHANATTMEAVPPKIHIDVSSNLGIWREDVLILGIQGEFEAKFCRELSWEAMGASNAWDKVPFRSCDNVGRSWNVPIWDRVREAFVKSSWNWQTRMEVNLPSRLSLNGIGFQEIAHLILKFLRHNDCHCLRRHKFRADIVFGQQIFTRPQLKI